MPAWVWVLIAVVVVAVVVVTVWQAMARRKTGHLQDRFGPEYDRTVDAADSKRDAESELQAREERRQRLEIRPLSQAARERYLERWQSVQSQFVDDPRTAVASADSLIQSVMEERGYPVEDFDQRADDLSVHHAEVTQRYREARRIAQANQDGNVDTEDLRQAVTSYRSLVQALLADDGDRNRDSGTQTEHDNNTKHDNQVTEREAKA